MATQRNVRIDWELYEEHLDEATFLWLQWERAMCGAAYTLREVATGPEERLLAHLDALLIGRHLIADRLLLPALDDDDPSRISSAAWVLVQPGADTQREAVFRALLGARDAPQRRALGRALELSDQADVAAQLQTRLGQHGPDLDAIILTVIAAHDPAALQRLPLLQLGARATDALLAAVLRAVLHAPSPHCRALVERGLSSADTEAHAAAIETGVLLRLPQTRAACRQTVAELPPCRRLALAALALLDDSHDRHFILDCRSSAELAADAAWALAFTGRIDCAERLLEALDDPAVAPIAADSFSSITGLAIQGPWMRIASPASLDEMVDADAPLPQLNPDDALPTPQADSVRAWWCANAPRFDHSQRYLHGQPWTEAAIRAALHDGATWRRQAFRLGLDAGAAARMNLRTWARRQGG